MSGLITDPSSLHVTQRSFDVEFGVAELPVEEIEYDVNPQVLSTERLKSSVLVRYAQEAVLARTKPGRIWYYWMQRSLDMVGAVVGLGMLAVVFPYVFYKIQKESPGAIFFKQQRTGLNQRVFVCYKIRTMHLHTQPNSDGITVTQPGDSRIFLFGGHLRRLNLDELPQFYNVLKGEMTLVGPRPYHVDECWHWSTLIPNWNCRYRVKPGITGLAQAHGHRGGTTDVRVMAERLRRDFRYMKMESNLFDLRIMIKTVKKMFIRNTGAH